jgi:hypothetical protein
MGLRRQINVLRAKETVLYNRKCLHCSPHAHVAHDPKRTSTRTRQAPSPKLQHHARVSSATDSCMVPTMRASTSWLYAWHGASFAAGRQWHNESTAAGTFSGCKRVCSGASAFQRYVCCWLTISEHAGAVLCQQRAWPLSPTHFLHFYRETRRTEKHNVS